MNLNPFQLVYDVDVFMKSGNVIKLRHVTKFEVKKNGTDIREITHGSKSAKCKVIHINVEQVEAIVQTGWHIVLRLLPRVV